MAYDPMIGFYDDPGHPYWPNGGNWHESGVVPSGGGGGGSLVLHVTGITIDTLSSVIYEAYKAGQHVVLVDTLADGNETVFSLVGAEHVTNTSQGDAPGYIFWFFDPFAAEESPNHTEWASNEDGYPRMGIQ